MHIQTQIVDLIPDKDNLITTKLLVSSRDSGCLEGKAGSVSEISRLTGASVQILARDEMPQCVSINDVVVQVCLSNFEDLCIYYYKVLLVLEENFHAYVDCWRDQSSSGCTC